MSLFDDLENITLSSKDGKAIVPAVVALFQSYHSKLDDTFCSLKEDFIKLVREKDKEITELKNSMNILQNRVSVLEDRIESNDSFERRDTLIFSGDNIPVQLSSENTSEIVCQLLATHLNMSISPSEISISHRLSGKSASQVAQRTPIIAKFCRQNMKIDVIARARKKKPTKLFVNESLTPMQQTISYVLRKTKRDFPNLVSGSTTFEGKNYVWIKAPNPEARGAKDTKMLISSHRRLMDFCTRTLNKPLTDYVKDWKH